MIEKDNVMCGTMVIVKEDFTPVWNWLLGRVVEVYHGSDGQSKKGAKLNRRLISGVWTVNSPQSHIVRVYDAGHGNSGVFHSAEWHDGDLSSDGIREAWLWFFIWVESF
ncbi:hypothetical protein TNCV_3945331 [Trichonephila clavipes]|nr:hypothetical protein TNCV_3945331 [Trichonephila clavipes]